MPLFSPDGAGGGGFLAPGRRSNHYLYNACRDGDAYGQNMTEGILYCLPFYNMGAPFTSDLITMRLWDDSNGSSGSLIRMGIYTVAPDGGIGDLIVDAGTTSGEGANVWRSRSISTVIPTGVVLVVAVASGTNVKPQWYSGARVPHDAFWLGNGAGNEWGPMETGWIKYSGYDATTALPSTGTRSGEQGQGDWFLHITLRVA